MKIDEAQCSIVNLHAALLIIFADVSVVVSTMAFLTSILFSRGESVEDDKNLKT